MSPSVIVDCFPECLVNYDSSTAIIAIDVIRATTTAVTGAVAGRRCFPVPDIDAAVAVAETLDDPIVGGELGGSIPYGFDLGNSPAELAVRQDIHRPMVLLSTSGTRVICGGQPTQTMYAACLRNWRAQVAYVVGRHERIAVVGAGARGEFRPEDELACAWIADGLVAGGYRPEDRRTEDAIERWSGAPVDAITTSKSAKYLQDTGQERDLAFILDHVNDVDAVLVLRENELVLEHLVG